ncbi:MAG: hypothetical protein ACXVZN_12210 [Gaiellaceae bacterium]
MADISSTELVQQRSMLIILIAACTSARTAFEAMVECEPVGDLRPTVVADDVEAPVTKQPISRTTSTAAGRAACQSVTA